MKLSLTRFLPVALLAAALLLSGCKRNAEAAQAASDAAAGGISGQPAGYFKVPQDQLAHVQVVTAKRADWTNELRLPGNVDYDQFDTTPVISPVGGPVARIMAVPGQQVSAGEVLLEVASPDYAQLRDTYLKARDALQLANRVYQRDQDLLAHKAIAEADLEQAESARNQAQADLEAAEQSMHILGIPDPQGSAAVTPMAQIPLKAPIAGQVIERDVAAGQLLQAGSTQCFVLSDMRKVWVMVNIFQSDLSHVKVNDPVVIDSNAFPEKLKGRIQFISPAMDPNSRTLQARIEVDNPNGTLKKDMYVTAQVQAGTLSNIIIVPDSAVLRDDQNNPFVYVATGQPGQFAQHAVTLGQSHDGNTQIASGLAPGDRVVGDGSLFLQFANSLSQ